MSGASVSPILNKTIVLEQLITPDFIDFLQRGSIEIEVWGKPPNKVSAAEHLGLAPEQALGSRALAERRYIVGNPDITQIIDPEEEEQGDDEKEEEDPERELTPEEMKLQIEVLREKKR